MAMPSSPGTGGPSTLGHHLCIGNYLVFRFKLGMLEASVRIFAAADVRQTYP
jgi:hypothetical protein